MPNPNVEYIAILRTGTGYDMEYLYLSPEGELRERSRALALQSDVEQVILCYETVLSADYAFCKRELRRGQISPDDITQLLD